MDVHSSETRSFNMSRIHGKDTKPEVRLRKVLWHLGYRYRKNYMELPGKPDLAFISKKKVIFINGCFWHKHDCKYFRWPKTNEQFWKDKITKNVERDRKNHMELERSGWDCLVVWECELKNKEFDQTLQRVINFINFH